MSFGKEKGDSKIQPTLDFDIFPRQRPYNYIWKKLCLLSVKCWWKPTHESHLLFSQWQMKFVSLLIQLAIYRYISGSLISQVFFLYTCRYVGNEIELNYHTRMRCHWKNMQKINFTIQIQFTFFTEICLAGNKTGIVLQ